MSKKILNLGCGKGQNIPGLLKKGTLYCVDINEDFISIAKKNFPDCNYLVSRAEDIEYPENFFDEVYCYDVLEHVDDLELVLEKIHKMLKKDGFLYVEVPYEHSEKMLIGTRSTYFDEIGHKRVFEVVKIQDYFKNFRIVKIKRERGVVNFYLWSLFKLGIGLSDQMSGVSNKNRLIERLIFLLTIWFDKNLFNTFLKYIPIWIITIPIGNIISFFFPKTIILEMVNSK